ncbi:MAG: hypothetical protein LBF72_02775 [Holosporales bacterium]|nr:hypothetical protein [Holosporales bacterium]
MLDKNKKRDGQANNSMVRNVLWFVLVNGRGKRDEFYKIGWWYIWGKDYAKHETNFIDRHFAVLIDSICWASRFPKSKYIFPNK